MDKRHRAELFRDRLTAQMDTTGMNRSALARACGVDRSTIAQLLADGAVRMPNAHLAAECARALGISADYLLGLSDRPERPGDLLATAVSVTEAERSSADEQLLRWHREASGYKIRHVPATLPDILKSEAVLNWEYDHFLGKTVAQAIGAKVDRANWFGTESSDYEIALPLGELKSFASGTGYYAGLDAALRREQLEMLAVAARDHYPGLRLFLFDSRRLFSAPVTVFGPLLAVVYIGRFYLAFRSKDRVRAMTEHFDGLVREAEIDARNSADWIDGLRRGVS